MKALSTNRNEKRVRGRAISIPGILLLLVAGICFASAYVTCWSTESPVGGQSLKAKYRFQQDSPH
jgi:hypothetical protein